MAQAKSKYVSVSTSDWVFVRFIVTEKKDITGKRWQVCEVCKNFYLQSSDQRLLLWVLTHASQVKRHLAEKINLYLSNFSMWDLRVEEWGWKKDKRWFVFIFLADCLMVIAFFVRGRETYTSTTSWVSSWLVWYPQNNQTQAIHVPTSQ